MAQIASETQPGDLPPVQKYMQAMAVCNSLALLVSQNTMLVFVQRLTLLQKLQSCWTDGSEVQIVVINGDFEPDLEGEVVGIVDSANDEIDVKLEQDFAAVVSQRVVRRTSLPENGESSDETIVDEPLACSAVSCDEADAFKTELDAVEEEKPALKKKKASRVRIRTKALKAEETEDANATPKRKRGRPPKVKQTEEETKKAVEKPVKRSRAEAKEETAEDPESSTFSFLCIICNEAFSNFVQLKEHKAEKHGRNDNAASVMSSPPSSSKRKKRSCTVCNHPCGDLSHLRIHMLKHTGERPHLCHVCGRGCASPAILKIHMRTHTGEKPHKCLECGAGFSQYSDLDYHRMARHTGEKPCVCTTCGYQCRKPSLLTYHMRRHTDEKPIECVFCGQRFHRPSALSQHKKRMHSKYKPELKKHVESLAK